MFKHLMPLFVVASTGLGFTSMAHAVPLVPGSNVFPVPGSSVAAEPQLAGTVVEDVSRTVSGNFTSSGLPFEVAIQDRVVRSVDGTYDFYYRITLTTKPDIYPLVVSRDGFAGYATNVGWRQDGLGTQEPASAFRTLDGDIVGFSWDFGEVLQGSQTRFFYVDTDAIAYAETATATINLSPSFDENGNATFSTFAPAVPEPQTVALMLAGLAALALAVRRRVDA